MSDLLLIDLMNILHAANGSTPLRVGTLPTQGVFGVVRTIRAAINRFPMLTPIVLLDGHSWRHAAYPEYKASRDAPPKTKSDVKKLALRAQIGPQKPYAMKALEHLGVRQMLALNLEADDLAGILVRKAREQDQGVVLMSGDKDWLQLVQKGVVWLDPIEGNRISSINISKRFGYCPDKKKISMFSRDQDEARGFLPMPSAQAWLEAKILSGDSSDEIGGVGGIGDKRAIELLREYGSVAEFLNRSIDGTLPSLPKYLEGFAADDKGQQTIYRRNKMLMDLNAKEIPEPAPLRIIRGKLDEAAFENLCADLMFKSILSDFDGWIAPFRSLK